MRFSVSIGVAMLDPEDEGFDEIFTRADEALYEAKRTGRNRAVLAGPTRDSGAGRAKETGSASEDTKPVCQPRP